MDTNARAVSALYLVECAAGTNGHSRQLVMRLMCQRSHNHAQEVLHREYS